MWLGQSRDVTAQDLWQTCFFRKDKCGGRSGSCWASESWGRCLAAAYLLACCAQPGALGVGLCAMESRLALRPLPRSVSSGR